MGVLIVTGEYPPMRGGIGDYSYLLAQALIHHNVKARVICKATGAVEPDDVPVERIIEDWGWKCLSQLASVAHRYQPEWLHVQYNPSMYDGKPAMLFAPLWLKRADPGMHMAITFHDLQRPRLIPKMHTLNRVLFFRSMALYDLVVTTNESDHLAVRKALDHRVPLDKIPIGSNIPVAPFSRDERARLRARLGFGPSDFVIAHFGTRSGLATLVEGFHILGGQGHSVGLLLIGKRLQPHPDDMADEREVLGEGVMEQLALAGLSDKVVGTGYLPAEDVSRHLQCADVLVLPHLPGISMARTSLLAGLAHGIPIVATIPAVLDPELQEGGNILLVEPSNAQALAEAVLLLQRDQCLRLQLQTGVSALGGDITWSAIATRHIAAYREVA